MTKREQKRLETLESRRVVKINWTTKTETNTLSDVEEAEYQALALKNLTDGYDYDGPQYSRGVVYC